MSSMSVLFACPYCHAETVVDDSYVGQSGPCAMCGRLITVPKDSLPRRATSESTPVGWNLGVLGMLIGVIVGSQAVGAIIIGFSVAIVGPAITASQAASLKNKSGDRLQLIAQAMLQYHAEYGRFPPAYVADAKGKPMHSWRVLLLPYLGERGLYQQYNFNLPWDSPTNMAIVSQMPEAYGSPGDPGVTLHDTSYLVIVGRNTIFPGNGSLNTNDITDGTGNTLLVVESTESGICWLEPRDLEASKMDYGVNTANSNCIRSHHPFGAQAAFADGKTHYLTNDLSAEFIEALSTAAKGDDVAGHAWSED